MSDVTITAANMIPGTGAVIVTGTAGEAIAIGQPVFLKPSDSRYYLSDADDIARVFLDGVSVSAAAAAGQPVHIQQGGQLAFGAALTVSAAAKITNKALTANVATLTTLAAHGFTTNEAVVIAGVDATFDTPAGSADIILSTPLTTTFTYARTHADVGSGAATGTATPVASGEIYIVSANVGKIAPFSDWTAGMALLIVGAALTTSNMLLKPWTPGVSI